MEQSHLDKPGPELYAKLRKLLGLPTHDIFGNPWTVETWNDIGWVVEEMRRRGWTWNIWENAKHTYCCELEALSIGNGIVFGCGITAPHAVCMAALSALEGQRDDKPTGAG